MKPEQVQLTAMAVEPVATLIVVVLSVFASNRHVDVRVADVKEVLRAEMRAEFAEMRLPIERNHSELLAKIADPDARLSRLEGERRIVR